RSSDLSATFAITTIPVSTPYTVTISASYGYPGLPVVTKTCKVNILAAALSHVNLSPANVDGGSASVGTVKLSGAAAADTVVTLSSGNSAATIPPTVTVPMGASSATFMI